MLEDKIKLELDRAEKAIRELNPSPNHDACELRIRKTCMYLIEKLLVIPTIFNRYGIPIDRWEAYRDHEHQRGHRLIPFDDWRDEGPQGEIRV